MAEIHSRLKTNADLRDQRSSRIPTEEVGESSLKFANSNEDIPVFCAGGCGEVMGFVRRDESIPTRRCSVCESARASEAASVKALPSNTDELAELRSPPRDLRKAHFVQVVAVALIFAGSIYIALGSSIGIYLAAVGTLAWIAVGLFLWRLRN